MRIIEQETKMRVAEKFGKNNLRRKSNPLRFRRRTPKRYFCYKGYFCYKRYFDMANDPSTGNAALLCQFKINKFSSKQFMSGKRLENSTSITDKSAGVTGTDNEGDKRSKLQFLFSFKLNKFDSLPLSLVFYIITKRSLLTLSRRI